MSATYRLVHFTPDPFTGARLSLGAVILADDGAVRVARVARLPGAECVGSRDLAVAVRRLHGRLASISSAEALPAAFGPYASLAAPERVPDEVPDPVVWVESLLNPVRERERAPATPRGAHRSTLGYRFFETWHVDRYVKKTFKAATDWDGWLHRHAAGLQEISHWVPGKKRVLLMEPVVPTRPHFEKDLQEIATRLLAYRYAVGHSENGRRGEVVAYVTAGGPQSLRAEAIEQLTPCAHRVVDTDAVGQRSAFIQAIEEIGSQGDPQATLPLPA